MKRNFAMIQEFPYHTWKWFFPGFREEPFLPAIFIYRQALTTLAPIDYVLRRISDSTLFFQLEAQP
ncbi:hypothetical protein [Pseudomonas sp. GM48]|uniref:hypothetical protein n=1 Tax=Pseudomonas sp. GM48 TaxID=1144330 RepID=UPI0002F9B147|nr:hypothetical protein [Pseudomonas sp. GM48]